MDDLFQDFFTSWWFAREVLNCDYEELADRITDLLTTKPVVALTSRYATLDPVGWVVYICPWPWLEIPVRCLSLKQQTALVKCMQFFCMEDINRNDDNCTMRGFTQNELLANKYYDRDKCVQTCFTFSVLQMQALGFPPKKALKITKEQMNINIDIKLLSKEEAPSIHKEATRETLFYE